MILICFDSIQIFEEIALLIFQVSWPHQFLTNTKKKLDFVFFPLGLSNFGWAACFPFDKGQSTLYNECLKYIIHYKSYRLQTLTGSLLQLLLECRSKSERKGRKLSLLSWKSVFLEIILFSLKNSVFKKQLLTTVYKKRSINTILLFIWYRFNQNKPSGS